MGKGSARRNEDTQKVWDNWDLIFGKKDKETKDIKEDDKKSTEKDESEKNK